MEFRYASLQPTRTQSGFSKAEKMKIFRCSLLIFITVLTACAPQNTLTQLPAPISTKTSFASTTPVSTQTLEPTATPITPTEVTLDPCSRIVEAKISTSGILEVVLEYEVESSDSIISEFGSPDGTRHLNLALWSEETRRAVPIPLPLDALNPKISTDHRWILFRRDRSETQSEFWVIGADGKGERQLGIVSLDEKIKARYPDGLFSLDYGWIPNTDTFFYEVDVTYGQIPPLIIESFVLVDVNSEKVVSLTNPSHIDQYRFSPDGSQMAFKTEQELTVLSVKDGQEQFTIQASLNYFMYSRDGNYIIDFTDDGILRIDARNGQQQIISLKYTVLSTQAEPSGYSPLPDFTWADDSTLFLISLNSDQRYIFLIPFLFNPDPDWIFTVWQIDLAAGTVHPIQSFRGDPSTARISPDMKWLAFQKYEVSAESKTRDLYLANLASGEILETISGGLFYVWLPGLEKYLYSTGFPYPPPGKGDSTTVPGESVTVNEYLGQVGGISILMNWDNVYWYDWWWADENRLVTDCKIVTFP